MKETELLGLHCLF